MSPSLSLKRLSSLSGISLAHLARIEQRKRQPLTHILQKIAKHLNFDLYELLTMAVHLLPDPSTFSEEQRDKLRTELNALLERVASDSNRLKEIINRLILSK